MKMKGKIRDTKKPSWRRGSRLRASAVGLWFLGVSDFFFGRLFLFICTPRGTVRRHRGSQSRSLEIRNIA